MKNANNVAKGTATGNAKITELDAQLVRAISTPNLQLCKTGRNEGKKKMCGYVHIEGDSHLRTVWGKYPEGAPEGLTTWNKGDELIMVTLQFEDDKSIIYQVVN